MISSGIIVSDSNEVCIALIYPKQAFLIFLRRGHQDGPDTHYQAWKLDKHKM